MPNKIKNLNEEKITFKRYFENLPKNGELSKKSLKKALRLYITESHFYNCLRNNKFKPILQKEIEAITKQQFNWTDDEI